MAAPLASSNLSVLSIIRVLDANGRLVGDVDLNNLNRFKSLEDGVTTYNLFSEPRITVRFRGGEGTLSEVLTLNATGGVLWDREFHFAWAYSLATYDISVAEGDCGRGNMLIGVLADTDGFTYCLDMATGKILWEIRGARHFSRPLLVDLTGDGKKDILVSTRAGVSILSLRDGETLRRLGPYAQIMAVFDADGDGRVDIVLSNGTAVQVVRAGETRGLIGVVLAAVIISILVAVWCYRRRRNSGPKSPREEILRVSRPRGAEQTPGPP